MLDIAPREELERHKPFWQPERAVLAVAAVGSNRHGAGLPDTPPLGGGDGVVRSAVRWLDAGMAALFGWAASLQLNDPDPAPWIAIYTAGGVVAAWSGLTTTSTDTARRRALALCAGLVALVCLAWAGVLWTALSGVDFPDWTASMTSDHPEVEWARELLGLLIVAAWSAGIVWRQVRARPRA